MHHKYGFFQEDVADTVSKSRDRVYPYLLEVNEAKLGETGSVLVRGQVVGAGAAGEALVQLA